MEKHECSETTIIGHLQSEATSFNRTPYQGPIQCGGGGGGGGFLPKLSDMCATTCMYIRNQVHTRVENMTAICSYIHTYVARTLS